MGANSGFDLWSSPTPTSDWERQLPSCEEGRLLLAQYFTSVDPIAHIIHRPSFEVECYNMGIQPLDLATTPASFKALILAVSFAAAVSLSTDQSELLLGMQKEKLVSKLKFATEIALVNAKHIDSVDMETLQAFAIFLASDSL